MKYAKKVLDKKAKRTKNRAGGNKMSNGYNNNLKVGKDGIYTYKIMVNGVHRTGTTGEITEEKAQKRLTILKAEWLQEDKGYQVKKAPTLTKALEIWKANKLGHVTDRYITISSRSIELHFLPTLGTKSIDGITKADLKSCLQAYILKTQKNKAVKNMGGYNQILTVLHSLFLEMKDCKYIKTYECIIPEYVDSQIKAKRVIDMTQFNSVIEVAKQRFTPDNYMAIMEGLYLGLRSVEISKATWSCINWSDKEFKNHDTKGKESEAIPVCEEMLEAFRELKKAREEVAGVPVLPSDFILPKADGSMREPRFFKYALKEAPIQAVRQA